MARPITPQKLQRCVDCGHPLPREAWRYGQALCAQPATCASIFGQRMADQGYLPQAWAETAVQIELLQRNVIKATEMERIVKRSVRGAGFIPRRLLDSMAERNASPVLQELPLREYLLLCFPEMKVRSKKKRKAMMEEPS